MDREEWRKAWKEMTNTRRPKGDVISGSRLYIKNATVNQVKKAVGKLAKKVRRAADGRVEVIHTATKGNYGRLLEKLKGFEVC